MKRLAVEQVVRRMGSRPAWGAWIETIARADVDHRLWSRPAWGAWIETIPSLIMQALRKVAPRMGRVD